MSLRADSLLGHYIKRIPSHRKRCRSGKEIQPLLVGEPSMQDTVSMLRGIKDRYEVHHGVRIADSSLVAATNLSNRYISDRFLPDKAIDLVD